MRSLAVIVRPPASGAFIASSTAIMRAVSMCFRGFSSSDVVTGLNVSKSGSDPSVKPDDAYPEWLWELEKPTATLTDLHRAEFESLDFESVKRLRKLEYRDKIRNTNREKAK